MSKSDKNLLETAWWVALDAVAATADIAIGYPVITSALWLAKGFYGNSLELRRDRALEFVEAFQRELWLVNKQTLQSEDFQDGFVFMLEKYIRERNPKKREVAQKIFLWFATSQDKLEFDLERYTNAISLLTSAGLNYLIFVNKILKPRHIKMLEEQIIPLNIQDYPSHEEALQDLYRRFNILKSVKGIESQEPAEWLLDLESLWIVRTTHIWTLWWWMDENSFTPFGYRFLDFFEGEMLK